jgi:hypothetical protein
MAGSDGGKTWLKYGCFGCLGLVGIAVLLTAMLVGIALVKVESEEVEDHASTPEVSAGQAPLPGESFASLPPGGSGTIVLDLRNGAFAVEPAASGEPLQVEAKYDRNTYELSEVVETDEQGQWTYRLSFQRTGSAWITTIKELLGGTSPFVRVLLPPDVALDLELKVKSGGGEVELGGLWLTSADLTLDKGGLALEISEPLQAPMERMDIKAQMGGGALGSLGRGLGHLDHGQHVRNRGAASARRADRGRGDRPRRVPARVRNQTAHASIHRLQRTRRDRVHRLMEKTTMAEVRKSTIAGMLDIAAGVLALIGGFVCLLLGLIGGGVLSATVPEHLQGLAALPVALFVPLAVLQLIAGVLAIVGGYAALQGARWGLAVVGSVAALVCFFPLGIVAMILTALSESAIVKT